MTSVAPNTALTSASIDWGVYYTYAVQCMIDGTPIDVDWCKGFAEGADKLTPLNEAVVAEGTAEKVEEVENAIIDGSLHVFDTSTFTVDGKKLPHMRRMASNIFLTDISMNPSTVPLRHLILPSTESLLS